MVKTEAQAQSLQGQDQEPRSPELMRTRVGARDLWSWDSRPQAKGLRQNKVGHGWGVSAQSRAYHPKPLKAATLSTYNI